MIENIKMMTMSEEYAKEISKWNYEDKYSIYNMPTWNDMNEKNYSLTIEDKRNKEYKVFISKSSSELLAMCRYIEKYDKILIGVGVNPNYLSIGIGKNVINQFTKWLRNSFSNKTIYLEVRAWNNRAIECYKKCGYTIYDEFMQSTPLGYDKFYRLYYKNDI